MADEVAKPAAPAAPATATPPAAAPSTVISSDGGAKPGLVSEGVSLEDTGSERPSWLPEGVDKVDELKDYFEKTGKFAPKEGEAPAGDKPAESKPAEGDKPQEGEPKAYKDMTDAELVEVLNKAGGIYADPKYQPHAIKFERNGDLTAEERQQAATDLNVPLEYVNAFVDSQKQLRQVNTVAAENGKLASEMLSAQARSERLSIIGGEDQFKSFNDWVSDPANVKPDELNAYNNAKDETTARALLTKFADAWRQAGNGKAPRDLTQEGQQQGEGAKGGAQGYASLAEQLADQGKPEYQTDPAFRARVMARIAASTF